MVERSCIYKFIDRSQMAFSGGASLREVLDQVEHYHQLVRRAYGPIKNPLHLAFTSKFGLSTLAGYEYLRSRGVPLPDSNNLIQKVWPLKRHLRLVLFGGEDILDTRPNLIEY